MKAKARACILGVPMDLGASRRGVDMGPSAIRIAELQDRLERLGYDCRDLGDIPAPVRETRPHGSRNAKYLGEISRTCRQIFETISKAARSGAFPIVLGGDHSIACGTLAGVADAAHRRGNRLGLLWFDAHGDLNTPATSPSGNVHGMPLAAVLGKGPRALTGIGGFCPKILPEHAVLMGIRELDPPEQRLVKSLGLVCYTMKDIDGRGLKACLAEALAIVCRGTEGFHVSFDMDAVDPSVAPGVGTPVKGGLSYREAHLAMEMVADSRRLKSFELVEVNPVMDRENQTAVLAAELISSALGKRIL